MTQIGTAQLGPVQSEAGKEEGKNKNWLGSLCGARILESSLVIALAVPAQIFTARKGHRYDWNTSFLVAGYLGKIIS